jgi:hypothetical protein
LTALDKRSGITTRGVQSTRLLFKRGHMGTFEPEAGLATHELPEPPGCDADRGQPMVNAGHHKEATAPEALSPS